MIGLVKGARNESWTGRLLPFWPIIGAALLAAGCASSDIAVVSASEANADLIQGYRIAPGDTIKVTVFDEPTLSGEHLVGLDGHLPMPLIGEIPARDLTAEELSRKVSTSLSDGGFVLSPRVAVEISEHRPFFILGEVKNPGEYPFVSDLTIDQAIAKAGGYTPRATRSVVVLRRQNWAQGKRVRLGLDPLLIGPGDTIRVEEAFF